MPDFKSDSVVDGKLKGTRFLSGSVKEFWVLELMQPIESFCRRTSLTPNQISFLGFLLTLIAAFMLATNHLVWGGWFMIFAGCCDFLDGRIARMKGLQTESGAFFDSVLDRYMDFAVLAALAFLFSGSWIQVVVLASLLGSTATPYIKAKSESLGISASGGEMQRPERIVILGVGAMLSGYASCLSYPFFDKGEELPPYFLIAGLCVVAVASNLAALQRFFSTFRALKERDRASREPVYSASA